MTFCRGTGAYSESKGLSVIREDVAKFISERDGGIEVDAEDIFLTDGASQVFYARTVASEMSMHVAIILQEHSSVLASSVF